MKLYIKAKIIIYMQAENPGKKDIFPTYNQESAGKVVEVCRGYDKILIIGPPRSGKSFFIDNYLRDKLGNVKIDDFTPSIGRGKNEEVKGNKVIGFFERELPFIKSFKKLTKVKEEELRKVLGHWAPKPIYNDAKKRIGDSAHFTYFIPWSEVNECVNKGGCNDNVRDALSLIDESLEGRKIKWLHAEYIPPGLVNEVINLIKTSGREEASKKVSEWVKAYFESLKILGISEEIEWESSIPIYVSTFVEDAAKGFLSAVPFIIGGLAITAAGVALVAVITHKLLNEEGGNAVGEMIKLRNELKKLCRDGCEEFNELGKLIVYKLSMTTGASPEEAESALKHIAGLTEEELKREVEDLKKEFEDWKKRLEGLDENFKWLTEKNVAGVKAGNKGDFAKGRVYSDVKVDNDGLKIKVEKFKYYKVVRTGNFDKSINEVVEGLKKNGLVVLVGPKGIGKSTLSAAVIWELFDNRDIGQVANVSSFDFKNKNSEFQAFIENYNDQFSKYFGRLLILYDPVSMEFYEEGSDKKTLKPDIKDNLWSLLEVMSYQSDLKPFVLIVLPTDIYDTGNEIKAELDKYKFEVSLNNVEFLAEIIKEYASSCNLNSEILNGLAEKVSAYDSGYTLVARLVGEELAKNNCDVSKMEELIEKGEGNAEKFIANQINSFFKVVDEDREVNNYRLRVLAEVFAFRRRYVSHVDLGDPILTHGVIRIIESASNPPRSMSDEQVDWLVYRKHDLIEDTISKLLDGKDLSEASDPWKNYDELKKLAKKVETDALTYFIKKYGKSFISKLRKYDKCWKRAALIIGLGLEVSTDISLYKSEDLPEYLEPLKDVLDGCGIDEYLLADNRITELVLGLIIYSVNDTGGLFNIFEAFVDKFSDVVIEINRIYSIAEKSGPIFYARFYGLGLALIIANAVRLGKDVSSEDADKMLKMASLAILNISLLELIVPILRILEPLRDKAPYTYPVVLERAADMKNLGRDAVIYVFEQLNELKKHDDVIKRKWSILNVLIAYVDLLEKHYQFLMRDVKGIAQNIKDLLDMFGDTLLGKIARARVLAWELRRWSEEEISGTDVVSSANKMLKELDKLGRNVKSLLNNSELTDYVESRYIKVDEENVKREIKGESSLLKVALADYKLSIDKLDDAERLFGEAAEETKKIGEFSNYLIDSNWTLRIKFIKGSLAGNNLAKEYERLFKESLDNLMPSAMYIDPTSYILADYLISLALTNNVEIVADLLEKHRGILYAVKEVSVVTRLMLNVLFGSNNVMFNVSTREIIEAFDADIPYVLRPALYVAFGSFGSLKPEEVIYACEMWSGNAKKACKVAIDAAKGDKYATDILRKFLMEVTQGEDLWKVVSRLNSLGVSVDELNNIGSDYTDLVYELDGRSLIQMLASLTNDSNFALMLNALVNKDFDLARAIALRRFFYVYDKLYARLFLEAYKSCCDLNNENFKEVLAKLFFLFY